MLFDILRTVCPLSIQHFIIQHDGSPPPVPSEKNPGSPWQKTDRCSEIVKGTEPEWSEPNKFVIGAYPGPSLFPWDHCNTLTNENLDRIAILPLRDLYILCNLKIICFRLIIDYFPPFFFQGDFVPMWQRKSHNRQYNLR